MESTLNNASTGPGRDMGVLVQPGKIKKRKDSTNGNALACIFCRSKKIKVGPESALDANLRMSPLIVTVRIYARWLPEMQEIEHPLRLAKRGPAEEVRLSSYSAGFPLTMAVRLPKPISRTCRRALHNLKQLSRQLVPARSLSPLLHLLMKLSRQSSFVIPLLKSILPIRTTISFLDYVNDNRS